MTERPRPMDENSSQTTRVHRRLESIQKRQRPAVPMQGELDGQPLPELLQFLLTARRTGQLAIESDASARAAAIYLEAGRIIHASCPPLAGIEALYPLFLWRHGRFLFLSDATPDRVTIDAEANGLLLDGLRQADELDLALRRLPPATAVLYPTYDVEQRSAARIGVAAWNLLTHVDGLQSVEDLVYGTGPQPLQVALALVELVEAGLVCLDPGAAFLDRIVPRRCIGDLSGHCDPDSLAGRLLATADGHHNLRTLAWMLEANEHEVATVATSLIAACWLEVVVGHEEYRQHLAVPILPR